MAEIAATATGTTAHASFPLRSFDSGMPLAADLLRKRLSMLRLRRRGAALNDGDDDPDDDVWRRR